MDSTSDIKSEEAKTPETAAEEPRTDAEKLHDLETEYHAVKAGLAWYKIGFFFLLLVLIFSLTGNAYLYYFMNSVDSPLRKNEDMRQPNNGLEPPKEGTVSVTPTAAAMNTTPAPVPEAMDTWKDYKEETTGLTLKYPPEWQVADSRTPETPAGGNFQVVLQGPEGNINVNFGEALGGDCQQSFIKVKIKNGEVDACNLTREDGVESFEMMKMVLSPTMTATMDAFVNAPKETNRGKILGILSTVEFAK